MWIGSTVVVLENIVINQSFDAVLVRFYKCKIFKSFQCQFIHINILVLVLVIFFVSQEWHVGWSLILISLTLVMPCCTFHWFLPFRNPDYFFIMRLLKHFMRLFFILIFKLLFYFLYFCMKLLLCCLLLVVCVLDVH